jgi:hypothetical protein
MNSDDADEWEDDCTDTDDAVVVYEAEDTMQALLYRTMLEEAGIDVRERPFDEQDWLGHATQQAPYSQLLVRDDDAARACRLVEAFRREGEERAEREGYALHGVDMDDEIDESLADEAKRE